MRTWEASAPHHLRGQWTGSVCSRRAHVCLHTALQPLPPRELVATNRNHAGVGWDGMGCGKEALAAEEGAGGEERDLGRIIRVALPSRPSGEPKSCRLG